MNPQNEQKRLRALQEYQLRSAPTEKLDALARLAANLLQAPIALISIMEEDHQWFKAKIGIEIQRTPRDLSFCDHLISAGQPLIINDTHTDPRVVNNPFVTGEPHLRFYAGAPLKTAEGFTLGSLCVLDYKPRTINQEQQETLILLAAQAFDQLELHRQTQLLKEREASLEVQRNFFELGLDLLCTADKSLHFVELNQMWEFVLGWTRDELRAKPLTAFIHPDDLGTTIEETQTILQGIPSINFENRYLHKNGTWVTLSWHAVAKNGVIFAIARDMREYYQREAELKENIRQRQESEMHLRAVFEGMIEGVVVQDASGRVIRSNPAAEKILGLTSAQISQRELPSGWYTIKPDGALLPMEETPANIALQSGRATYNAKLGVHKSSGEISMLNLNVQPLRREGESLPHSIITTVQDITKQEESNTAMALERAFFRNILDNIPNSIVAVFNHDLQIEQRFGRPGLDDTEILRWATEKQRGAFKEAALRCLQGDVARVELSNDEKNFEVTLIPFVDAKRLVTQGLALAYDVSERDKLREQLSFQERFVTTGTLAAGVGHEINNPLTYIVGNLDFVAAELSSQGTPLSARQQEILDSVEDARRGTEQIRKIVRGLRALAREDRAVVPTDVLSALEIAINMSMYEVRPKATLATELSTVPRVMADEPRLSQVFISLIVNAAQAFLSDTPEKNYIKIKSYPSGEHIIVEISDNGPGIPPDTLPRIFDPFFTTKPIGQGTGLGLSISNSIVLALGGEISCETELNVGTTFRVRLPAAQELKPTELKEESTLGRILVIDDDAIVLKSLGRLLRGSYEAVLLSDPREALQRIQQDERFDVIFCDLSMPYLSGGQLYTRAIQHNPALAPRFIFITGGIQQRETAELLTKSNSEIIDKPFSTKSITDAIQRVFRKATP